MTIATVFHTRYRPAAVLGIICLALMLVLLGAVAKNSQFQSPSHSNHYLKQSVKMVSGQDDARALCPPATSTPVLLMVDSVPIPFRLTPSEPPQRPFIPLLI